MPKKLDHLRESLRNGRLIESFFPSCKILHDVGHVVPFWYMEEDFYEKQNSFGFSSSNYLPKWKFFQ